MTSEYNIDEVEEYHMFSTIEKEGRGEIMYIHKLF